MFIDRVRVEVRAGSGGNGVVAWRREKYIPKGGPSGGDGGIGGSVILYVDPNIYALDHFKHTRIVKAENGAQGAGACRKGRNGNDLILKIPPGTLVKDALTGEILFDATEIHQQFSLCTGGIGGKGNFRFRSPTNQAPTICTPGTEGKHRHVELELKMIADIGLVGFPNAGKSSLLSILAHRKNVKVAEYPFTTLTPNLGFITFKGGKRLLMADIPGIIKGAHNDRGLGLEFLRHIERTSMLIYVIDTSGYDGRDPEEDFVTLQEELFAYDPELLKRPSFILLNKLDRDEAVERESAFRARFSSLSIPIFSISCETEEGILDLKESIKNRLFP
ncbi:MAG: GTPase ObgE [Chlamydia sp.]